WWCFYFSSRRRHTRFKCDWSSDVCSSDLFVARFVGEVNVLDGVASGGQAAVGALAVPVDNATDGSRVRVVIRSYDLKFWRSPSGDRKSVVEGKSVRRGRRRGSGG